MTKKKSRKMAAFLAAVLAAALCLCQAAFAAESAGIEEEEDRQSTLSIDLEGQDKTATMALYHVGEWDGSQGAYVPIDAFQGAGVSFADMMSEEGMTVDEMEAACETLIAYAAANGIQAVDTQTTEGGKLQFMPVGTGLYLVAQAGDASTFRVASFLTTLPMLEDGIWEYAVEAHPKNADVPVPPTQAPTEAPTQPGGNGSSSGGGRTRRTSDASGTAIGDGDVPLDTIEDDPTPLGQILDTIEDALTPLAGLLPKTGDRSIAYLPLFLAFLASGAGIVLFAAKRKREA